MSDTPKEDAYDTHIQPLMNTIIALCKDHKINAFATFALDDSEDDGGPQTMCTTALPMDPEDERGIAVVNGCRDMVYRGPSVATVVLTA